LHYEIRFLLPSDEMTVTAGRGLLTRDSRKNASLAVSRNSGNPRDESKIPYPLIEASRPYIGAGIDVELLPMLPEERFHENYVEQGLEIL
jgi:hypothetical protein